MSIIIGVGKPVKVDAQRQLMLKGNSKFKCKTRGASTKYKSIGKLKKGQK